MTTVPAPLSPPERLLCGPGPANISEAVLTAMTQPLLGHTDPVFADVMTDVVAMLRSLYNASGGVVLPLQATGTSGMETGLSHLLEPGEKVIVGVNGFFGRRIVDMAGRLGATVIEVAADWGEHVPNERLLEALRAHPDARLMAVVHAETSTGVEHPLAELGAALRDRGVLLMADCVTSLGGIEVDIDGWGVDYAYSCTQKCIGSPPGLSPVAASERAMDRIAARARPVPFSFDLRLLERYWIGRPPAYHHTTPILAVYALHESLREVLQEGKAARWERHRDAGRFLQDELHARGLELLAEPEHQLPQLSAVRVPEGVDGKRVQTRLLAEHGIEVGGGLAGAPPMWRIGLMGFNARRSVAERVLTALDAVLADEPAVSRSA